MLGASNPWAGPRYPLVVSADAWESDVLIQVERVWNPGDSRAEAYGVTAKQREALALAAAEGYFAVPRETNLTDLAEELDITRQSLSRRMARGQRTLLNNTLLRESPSHE